MSHNTLIEKIKQDVATTIATIKTEGEAKVAEIERETETVIADMVKNHEAKLHKQHEQMELVAVSQARQASRIAIQEAKRNQVNQLFSEVLNELINQNSEAYVSCFVNLAKDISETKIAIQSVSAPTNRVNETKQIIAKLMGQEIEIVPVNEIKAGFVINALDGVYDYTLERIMSEKRPELEMKVIKMLAS